MPADPANCLQEETESVIRRVVRNKLRVTLRSDDGRERNLDAFDLLGDIRLKLVRKLRQEDGEPVESWSSYAATTAYNCCADYLRARYPHRSRLRNALRRLLDVTNGYAVWADAVGELLCGFAGQQHHTPAAEAEAVARLQQDPSKLAGLVPPQSSCDNIPPGALLQLVEATLEEAGGPVALDDLVSFAGKLLGIEDVSGISLSGSSDEDSSPAPDPAAREPGPESAWLARERLLLLWGSVQQLLPWHRAAYLLNLRDGELEAFPYYGVASMEEIGDSLALSDAQFDLLAEELRLDADLRSQSSILPGSGQKFMIYSQFLPVEDNVIAKMLGVTRAQVIGYRNKAVERLRRQLRGSV